MNMNRYFTALLLLLVPLVIYIDYANAGSERRKGTAGATELLIPVGSRGSALSGSINALASGVEAIHWNPAGVVNSKGVEAMFSTLRYLADIKLNYFAVSSNFGDAGAIALSLRSLDFGDIPRTTVDLPDGSLGTFSPNYISGGLTYSRAFTDRIHGGVTMKVISERIVRTSAYGIAFDFGVQYISKETGIMLGVSLKNLGPQMSFDGPDLESFVSVPGQDPGSRPRALRLPGAEFELPSTLEIGVGYHYQLIEDHAVTFSGDFQNSNFGNDEFRLGVEYNYLERFYARGGYMISQNQDDNIYGPTFGVGVNIPIETSTITFDYAYRHSDFFDANQWFTIKVGL